MFALVGSIVLSIINAGVMILLAKRMRIGWTITFFTHIVLWIPYSWLTGQWGFLGLAIVHAIVAVKGRRDWTAESEGARTEDQLRNLDMESEAW